MSGSDWVKRGLIAGGCLYAIALIPGNIRPSWTHAPLSKPDQTITVPAETPSCRPPSSIGSKIRKACLSPRWVRSLEGPAKHVRVVYTWAERPIVAKEYVCASYLE